MLNLVLRFPCELRIIMLLSKSLTKLKAGASTVIDPRKNEFPYGKTEHRISSETQNLSQNIMWPFRIFGYFFLLVYCVVLTSMIVVQQVVVLVLFPVLDPHHHAVPALLHSSLHHDTWNKQNWDEHKEAWTSGDNPSISIIQGRNITLTAAS